MLTTAVYGSPWAGHRPRHGRMAAVSTYPIYTQEHDELRESVRRYVDKELRPHVDEWEEAGYFPDDVFRRCGELGFLGLHYPERWGGSGGDLTSGLVFVEELARCGCGGVPMALSVQTHMCTPALGGVRLRRPAGAAGCGPPIAGEKIGAIAITEPDAGSDVAGISTRARARRRQLGDQRPEAVHHQRAPRRLPHLRRPDRSRLRAPRHLAVHRRHEAARACRCRGSCRSSGCSRATPRRSRSTTWSCRTSYLIGGEPGQGFAQLMWQLQYERLSGAAGSIGTAQEILDQTIAYARERHAVRSSDRRPSR